MHAISVKIQEISTSISKVLPPGFLYNFNGVVITFNVVISVIKNLSDIVIKVPSNNTQNIQESHLVIGHIICEIIENFSIEKR